MYTKYLLCFFLFLNSIAWSNVRFLNALISTGSYSQASLLLNRLPTQDSTTAFYRGLLQFCQGQHTEGLSMLRAFYDKVDANTKQQCFDFLISYLENNELPLTQIMEVAGLFKIEVSASPNWDFVLNSARFRSGQYVEIIENFSGMNSEKEFSLLFNAYQEANRRAEFYTKFSENPPTQPEAWFFFLRLLLKKPDIETAERLFSAREPELSPAEKADLYIFLGTELSDFARQEKGWRLKLSITPTDFLAIRGLAALYYRHNQPEKAEKELFDYLKNTRGQITVARNIARFMADHGRYQALISFVLQKRAETGNKLLFSELLLPIYALQKNYDSFFSELEQMYRGFHEKAWAQALFDYFETFDLEQSFQEFLRIYASQGAVAIRVLSILSQLLENAEQFLWISNYFAGLPEPDLMVQVELAYQNKEYVAMLCMLTEAIKNPEQLSVKLCRLAGIALFQLSRFTEALPLLMRAAKSLEFLDQQLLLTLLPCAINAGSDFNHKVFIWLRQLGLTNLQKLPTAVQNDILNIYLLNLVFFDYDEELQKLLQEKIVDDNSILAYVEVLRLLKDPDYAQLTAALEGFLNNHLESTNYTAATFLYLFLLETSAFWSESFFPNLFSAWFYWQRGDISLLSQAIAESQAQLEGHYALFTLQKYLDFFTLMALNLARLEKPADYEQEWLNSGLNFVKNYPDFIYNSRLVETLFLYYQAKNMTAEKSELLQNYLLYQTFSLTAQKLRNSI